MTMYKPGRPHKYTPSTGTGSKPPAKPGEYRIRDSKGVIIYVGETNNLERRTKEHSRKGKLTDKRAEGGSIEWKVADGRSTSRTRRIHERQKIEQHTPSMNKSSGGEGRIAKH